ncbi:MAG TPA: hypothetical protein VIK18_05315, partial [Pirellulales bacterium]
MRALNAWMYDRLRLGARRRALQRSKSAAKAVARRLSFEALEGRRLLAVTETFAGGALTVDLSASLDAATLSATAAASGGAQSIQLAGTGFTTQTFVGVTSVVINYGYETESVTLNGTAAIAIGGALGVNDPGNSIGETLTFANTTSYSFASASILADTTGPGVATVAIDDSLATASGTLTIGTGVSSTSPKVTFGGTGTISAAGGDIDISAFDDPTMAITTPLSDPSGTVRLVNESTITDSSTITAANLSVTNLDDNELLEGDNAVSGTVAFSPGALKSVSFNDGGSTALTVGTVAASGSFAAVTGVNAGDEVNIVSGGTLTIDSPIQDSNSGSVRFIAAGEITQSSAGTITAQSLSITNTGSAGDAVLEAANTVHTLATTNSASGGALSFLTSDAGVTISTVAAATQDPDALFGAVVGITTNDGDVNLDTDGSGGVTIDQPINVGTADVRVVSAFGLSQTTTATVTAASLAIANTGATIKLESSNDVGTLALDSTAPLGVTVFSVGSNNLIVGSVAAAAITVDPDGLFATVTGITADDGNVDVSSGGLEIEDAVAISGAAFRLAESGNVTQTATATITASKLALSNSAGSTVLEAANDITTLVASDTAAGSYLTLNNGTNALYIGSITAENVNVDTSGLFGAITGITTDNDDVNLQSGGVTIDQAIAAGTGTVRIAVAGNVSQVSPGTITAAGLSIANSTGSSVLELSNNVGTLAVSNSASGAAFTFNNSTTALAIGTVAAPGLPEDPNTLFAASSGITISNADVNLAAGAIAINQAVAAGTGNMRLVAAGISQASPGTLTAGALSLSNSSGNVLLELSNSIGTLAATNSASAGAVSFTSINTVTLSTVAAAGDAAGIFAAVTGITTFNGDVNLDTNGLNIDNPIAAGTGTVRLAGSGAMTQLAAGTITAANLDISIGAANAVLEAANDVGTFASTATSSPSALTFSNGANALTIGSVAGESLALDPGRLFSFAVTGVQSGSSGTANSGDIDIVSGALAIIDQVDAAGSSNDVRIVASGAVTESGSGRIVGTLSVVTSSGNIVLESNNGIPATIAANDTAAGASVAYNSIFNGTVGSVPAAATSLDPNRLFGTVTGITTSNGDVNLDTGGLTISSAISAGTGIVRLVELGAVTQTAGIAAAGLSISNSSVNGKLILESTNAVGTLAVSDTGSTEPLSFNDGTTALTIGSIAAAPANVDPSGLFPPVTGVTTKNGDVNLLSAGLSFGQPISAGTGNVRLVESAAVTWGTITASGLSFSNSGGNVTLGSTIDVATLAAMNSSAGSSFTYDYGNTVIGTIAAPTAVADPNDIFSAISGITTHGGAISVVSTGANTSLTANANIVSGGGSITLQATG